MSRADWLQAAEFFLAAHGPYHFRAYEIADVGRMEGDATLTAPEPHLLLTALKLIDVLEWLRWYEDIAPVHVTSWYRGPAYNAAVGGSVGSMHLTCGAADVTKDGWEPEQVARALDRYYPQAEKLGIGKYDTFTHVDIRGMLGRPTPARWPTERWRIA